MIGIYEFHTKKFKNLGNMNFFSFLNTLNNFY